MLREWSPSGNAKVQAQKLERALRGVRDDYDAVLIDCAPGLGPLPCPRYIVQDPAQLGTGKIGVDQKPGGIFDMIA